jgi:hypothetical protein
MRAFSLSQFLCQVHALGADGGSLPEAPVRCSRAALFIELAGSHHAKMISFETSPPSTPAPCFWTEEPGLNNLSPPSPWAVWLPYGNCVTVLLMRKSSEVFS